MVDTAKRRKPNFAAINASPSGRVTRDEHGNAVWQWGHNREEMHGSVNHLGLSVDDGPQSPSANAKERTEPPDHNPYDSGPTEQQKRGKQRDLRALSRHIEEQRKRAKGENS